MNKKIQIVIMVLFFSLPVFSHYKWIIPETGISGAEKGIMFRICCGHKFPENELLLKREMIGSVYFVDHGVKKPVEILRKGKTWTGVVDAVPDSEYLIVFSLKKKLSKTPFFYGRAVVFPGKREADDEKLFSGQGLEIIPEDLFNKKMSDDLRIRILSDGKSVRSKLIVIPEGKKPVYLYSGKTNHYFLKLKYSGYYLLSTFYKGKSTSLTFFIKENNK